MRPLLAASIFVVLAVVLVRSLPTDSNQPVPREEQQTQKSPPTERTEPSIVFIGHAYPMNGFDKSLFREYLGWKPGTLPQETRGGTPIARRLEINSKTELIRSSFFDPLAALEPDRWVWGGDSLYRDTRPSRDYFFNLVDEYKHIPHVYIPGNHDCALLKAKRIESHFHNPEQNEETLAGIRVLYVNTVTENGAKMAPTKSHCVPSDTWLGEFKASIASDQGERGMVIMLHHAPWFTGKSQANVTHKENPWWDAIHPLLKEKVIAGKSVLVLSGDGGHSCLADGMIRDGIKYCVTGQPTNDRPIPNGFLRLSWTATSKEVQVDAFTWTPEGGIEEHMAPEYPWRF